MYVIPPLVSESVFGRNTLRNENGFVESKCEILKGRNNLVLCGTLEETIKGVKICVLRYVNMEFKGECR